MYFTENSIIVFCSNGIYNVRQSHSIRSKWLKHSVCAKQPVIGNVDATSYQMGQWTRFFSMNLRIKVATLNHYLNQFDPGELFQRKCQSKLKKWFNKWTNKNCSPSWHFDPSTVVFMGRKRMRDVSNHSEHMMCDLQRRSMPKFVVHKGPGGTSLDVLCVDVPRRIISVIQTDCYTVQKRMQQVTKGSFY